MRFSAAVFVTLLLVLGVGCLVVPRTPEGVTGATGSKGHGETVEKQSPDYWPNEVSSANSDDWLVENHDRIRVMRPKVLVLVFMNGWYDEVAYTEQMIKALAESTRYHGYKDPDAPAFMNDLGDSYLIVISDGMDTCGPDGVFNTNNATAEQLGALSAQILSEMNIKTYVIGFGSEVDPYQLNAIAENGGTGINTYFDAADSTELNAVLHDIGETVAVSCTFDIGEYDPEEFNLDYVNIKFDDEPVPRDDDCAENLGWTWTDESRTGLHFCEAACDALTGTSVQEVSVTIACSLEDVIII